MRIGTKAKSWGDISLVELQHAVYNPTAMVNGNWTITLETADQFSDAHSDFMLWANYTNDANRTKYNPIVDFLGPVGFHPLNCFA